MLQENYYMNKLMECKLMEICNDTLSVINKTSKWVDSKLITWEWTREGIMDMVTVLYALIFLCANCLL